MLLRWELVLFVCWGATVAVAMTPATPKTVEVEPTPAAEVNQTAGKHNHQEVWGHGPEDSESTVQLPPPPTVEGKCGVDVGEAAELAMESGINTTGHWHTKVRLEHAASPSAEGGRLPVQLQMRRWARRGRNAGSARIITLQATLSGPSESSSSSDDFPWNGWNGHCPSGPTASPDGAPEECPPPPRCAACPSAHLPEKCPSPCPSPCPSVPTCPSSPTVSPNPPFLQCPSPCPSPAPCPACPTPEPTVCPTPCPSCPKCPDCPPAHSCPSPCSTPLPLGFERFSGYSAYRLHLIPLNWFEAKATCERQGAHLAIINSQGEADVISNYLQRSRDVNVYYVLIGFHDIHSEGKYFTVLDMPLSSAGYYKWNPGEPNNADNEDCGGIYVNGMSLNDEKCSISAPFLCEIP